MLEKLVRSFLIAVVILSCAAVDCCQSRPADTKQDILNAVTIIKPIQQIILDYLDIPDQIVYRLKYNIENKLSSCSENYIVVADRRIYPHGMMKIGKRTQSANSLIMWENSWPLNLMAPRLEGNASIHDLQISPDGENIACVIENIYDAKIFTVSETRTGKQLYKHDLKQNSILKIEFSPNSAYIALVFVSSTDIIDAPTGKPIWTISDPDKLPRFSFSPDGNKIATVFGNQNLIVHNLKTPEAVLVKKQFISEPPEKLKSLVFSPDGVYILCQYSHQTALYEFKTGRQCASILQSLPACTYSPDSTLIAHTDQKGIVFRDAKTVAFRYAIDIKTALTGTFIDLQFLFSGDSLLVTCRNGRIKEHIILKNQALDLDCPKTTISNFVDDSFCTIS